MSLFSQDRHFGFWVSHVTFTSLPAKSCDRATSGCTNRSLLFCRMVQSFPLPRYTSLIMDRQEILSIYNELTCFEYNLKEEQLEVIEGVLNGVDQLVSLPTGFGKSLCYVLPPLLLEKVSWIHLLSFRYIYIHPCRQSFKYLFIVLRSKIRCSVWMDTLILPKLGVCDLPIFPLLMIIFISRCDNFADAEN